MNDSQAAIPRKTWLILAAQQPIPPDVDEQLKSAIRQTLPDKTQFEFFRQILFNRGITTVEGARRFIDLIGFVDGDPWRMLGMQHAVERLQRAILQAERIVVYGDYDVDGVTATALMVQAITALGGTASAYIPDRFEEGYGLNVEAIEKLAADGARVIVSVDCGVRSLPEALCAQTLGVDLIITDHHMPKDQLPEAYALICPKQPGETYQEQNLSGVGIAYRLAQALIQRFPDSGVEVSQWLDLVALGTVADMVPLTGENRAFVRHGIDVLRAGTRPGLYALANVAGITLDTLNAASIGFGLAPRLNAAGRLDTAMTAYDLLMAQDAITAGPLVQKLDNNNSQRKSRMQQIQQQAQAMIAADAPALILFAFDPQFDEGIVGLAASRLTERSYRPAIVGRIDAEKGLVRASCRSIPEFHITEALDQCKDLFERHGGHALAAGFTLPLANLPAFQERMNAIAQERLGHLDLRPILRADVEFPLEKLAVKYIHEFLWYLDQLQPTGQGNHEAVFVSRNLRINRILRMGGGQHFKLMLSAGPTTWEAVAFNQSHWLEADALHVGDVVDLMYTFDLNVWNGRTTLQLRVRDIDPHVAPITGD